MVEVWKLGGKSQPDGWQFKIEYWHLIIVIFKELKVNIIQSVRETRKTPQPDGWQPPVEVGRSGGGLVVPL